MKTRILRRLAASALTMVSAATLISCSQPPIECTSARGPFALKYYLVSGTGACAEYGGETVGLQTYNPADNLDDCEQRGDDVVCSGTKPDFTKTSLAVQAESLGNLLYVDAPDENPEHKLYSLGEFKSTEPDGDDFCRVDSLSVSQQSIPEVPSDVAGDPPLQDAYDLQYQWSNVKLYVTAAAPGTQIEADLTLTEDGCSAQYKAVGLYPSVFCGAFDDEGNFLGTDDKACEPEADPEKGYAYGSGINPDFPVVCDPDILLCVLRESASGQAPKIPVTTAE